MLKHLSINDRDIQRREERDESAQNRPKQKLIPPHINHPLSEILLGPRLHGEERPTDIDQLPGQEQRKPSETGKGGGSSFEDGIAPFGIGVIAVFTELSVTKSIHPQDEAGQTQRGDPDAVNNHVDAEFPGEDARLETLWRTSHDIRNGAFKTETHVGETRGDHDDPDDFDRGEGEDREVVGVLEGQSDEEGSGLGDILRQNVKDEFLDVVEDATAFLDGGDDGGKVVVGQDNIGGVFCYVGAGLAHCDADVCAAEGGRVVDAVAGLEGVSCVTAEKGQG